MTIEAEDITTSEEKALLKEWFETVQFDVEYPGVPPMKDEVDDEETRAAAIADWFRDGGPVPRDIDDSIWSLVDEDEIGMSRLAARAIYQQELEFQEMFGRFNPNHSKTTGQFASTKGGIGGLAIAASKTSAATLSPEMADRAKAVEGSIGSARKTIATEVTHTLPGGAWHPDRDKIHREIADEVYARSAHIPNDRKAVVAGGLGGAGKTTVLTKYAGVKTDDYLTLNPDDIKEEFAKRNLIPEVPGHDLSPMERAALVHEESSRVTQLIAKKAYADGKNVMWDITMSSQGSVQARLDALKKHGYTDVRGVFVDIPTEVSVSRAMSRYERGQKAYMTSGKGLGGRYVPPVIIRAQKTSSGGTINRANFEDMKNQFSSWSVYDNSVDGRAPELIKESK
jgi:hypothetical protein